MCKIISYLNNDRQVFKSGSRLLDEYGVRDLATMYQRKGFSSQRDSDNVYVLRFHSRM
jgi:hypothetical protein